MKSATRPTVTSVKTCRLCGEDCSARARIRDPRGNYYCRSCHEHAGSANAHLGDDSAVDFALLDEVCEAAVAPCPGCAQPLPGTAVVCCVCGWHRGRAGSLATTVHGLPSDVPARSARKQDAGPSVASMYLTPIVMFVLGAGLVAGLIAHFNGPAAAQTYLLGYALMVPIGLAVFLGCCALWIGFDAPLHVTAIRLAGIYAVVDAVSLIPIVGWLVGIITYVLLLSEMLEIDTTDACAVAILTFLVKILILGTLMALVIAGSM